MAQNPNKEVHSSSSLRNSINRVSPAIQNLLNMVQEETRKVQSLSKRLAPYMTQRCVSEVSVHSSDESQHHSADGSVLVDQRDQSRPRPPVTWEQEKTALQETVTAQIELLCTIAQKHTQAVDVSVEQHRSEVMTLQGQLERERVACSNLRRELQTEQSRHVLLEQHLADAQKDLEDERQRSAKQKAVSVQEKTRLECLLNEAEYRIAEIHFKVGDAQRKSDEERESFSRKLDDLNCRHEAEADRNSELMSDMRVQLDQERRKQEELAAVADKLRAELLQSRRRWEEEDKMRKEEAQWELEAANRIRVAMDTLKEQTEESSRALEVERERSKHQRRELLKLQETVRLLKDKEMRREEQCWRESRKKTQEQTEKKERQKRTNSDMTQRLYERWLRAESHRKALAYQKRYLLDQVGKYQACEQEVIRLLAEMGAPASPCCSYKLSPLGRFRAAVRVVIAVSRMRFLKRFSEPGTVHGQAPGSSDPKMSSLWSNTKYCVFVQPK